MAIEERPTTRGKADGDGPAIVTDHPFKPKAEWWSLCKACNLSEAAHAETTLKFRYWDDDYQQEE